MNRLWLLIIAMLLSATSYAAFVARPSFYERAMVQRPTPELKSPFQAELANVMQPVDGANVRAMALPERKRQLGTRLIIAGAILMLAGGGLIAYGSNYYDTHHGDDKVPGIAYQFMGIVSCLVGLLALIGTGVYLHIRYR
jgi:hypothetical protein